MKIELSISASGEWLDDVPVAPVYNATLTGDFGVRRIVNEHPTRQELAFSLNCMAALLTGAELPRLTLKDSVLREGKDNHQLRISQFGGTILTFRYSETENVVIDFGAASTTLGFSEALALIKWLQCVIATNYPHLCDTTKG